MYRRNRGGINENDPNWIVGMRENMDGNEIVKHFCHKDYRYDFEEGEEFYNLLGTVVKVSKTIRESIGNPTMKYYDGEDYCFSLDIVEEIVDRR